MFIVTVPRNQENSDWLFYLVEKARIILIYYQMEGGFKPSNWVLAAV